MLDICCDYIDSIYRTYTILMQYRRSADIANVVSLMLLRRLSHTAKLTHHMELLKVLNLHKNINMANIIETNLNRVTKKENVKIRYWRNAVFQSTIVEY